jgi:hypothetical protein
MTDDKPKPLRDLPPRQEMPERPGAASHRQQGAQAQQ